MRKFILFFILVTCFLSCKKKEESVSLIDLHANYLTGSLNKTWFLKSIYINGVPQQLSIGQARYNKTYRKNGTWTDSDGYIGFFSFKTAFSLNEVSENTTPPNVNVDYKINSITENKLDVEYSYNSQAFRFVYEF